MTSLFGSSLSAPAAVASAASARLQSSATGGAGFSTARWWEGLDASSGPMIGTGLSLGASGLSAAEHAQRVLGHLLDEHEPR